MGLGNCNRCGGRIFPHPEIPGPICTCRQGPLLREKELYSELGHKLKAWVSEAAKGWFEGELYWYQIWTFITLSVGTTILYDTLFNSVGGIIKLRQEVNHILLQMTLIADIPLSFAIAMNMLRRKTRKNRGGQDKDLPDSSGDSNSY